MEVASSTELGDGTEPAVDGPKMKTRMQKYENI